MQLTFEMLFERKKNNYLTFA